MLIRFFKDFILGLVSFYKATLLVFQSNIWLFFFIPILLQVGLFWAGEELLVEIRKIDFEEMVSLIDFDKEIHEITFQGAPTGTYWIPILINGIKLISVVVLIAFNKYIVLILMAPVMAKLSEKAEKYVTGGNVYPFELGQFIQDIYRGVNFSLRNMFRQIVIIAIWYSLTLVFPIDERVTYVFIFLVSSYYYGSSLMDYVNERRRLSLEESVKFIKRNFGLALSIGVIFASLFFVKYVGIVLAPIIGVIAAVYGIHDKVNLKKNKFASKEQKEVGNVPKNPESFYDEWADG